MISSVYDFTMVDSIFEDRFISAVSTTEDVLIRYPIIYKIKKQQVVTFDEKGIPYYEIFLKYSDSDIISNIKVEYEDKNIRYDLKLVVNGNIHTIIPTEIYICALLFTNIKIRVYFPDIISIPESFTIEYYGYIFSNIEDRRYFQRNLFQTKEYIYEGGMLYSK